MKCHIMFKRMTAKFHSLYSWHNFTKRTIVNVMVESGNHMNHAMTFYAIIETGYGTSLCFSELREIPKRKYS